MNLISISEASKTIADKKLYDNISFGINEGEKIAIIGVNGSGKSTLLRILSRLDEFDSGNFASNKILSSGYLEQKVEFKDSQTILQFIFSSENRRMKTLQHYLELQQQISEENSETLSEEIERTEDLMNELEVWRVESEAREILHHLDIKDTTLQMVKLSGGMARKVALARLLLEESNLLMLDEPTNHLDIASISWLESYLIKINKAVILITHDRYFLDNVVDHILEIDNLQLNKFKGNYTEYLQKKSAIAEIDERTASKHINILRTELDWLSRMPRARGTKQKARIDKIGDRQADLAKLKKGPAMSNFHSNEQRLGKKILEIINIEKSFGDEKVILPFSYEFVKKERIAIVGNNGTGKTTFLHILLKELTADSGKVIHGVNTKTGYLSQIRASVSEELSVIQAVKDIANYIEYEDGKKLTASQLLDKFLFSGNRQHQKIRYLSGGERQRLDIIRVLMTNPNFLILDEPTNDLDLQTLNILEDYLLNFGGCLLVVSHDRYFLDKLTNKIFLFEKNKPIKVVFGRVSEYISEKKSKTRATKSVEVKKKKLPYKIKQRLLAIEKEIPLLEAAIKNLEQQLSSGETSHELLQQWGQQHLEKEEVLMTLLTELEEIEHL